MKVLITFAFIVLVSIAFAQAEEKSGKFEWDLALITQNDFFGKFAENICDLPHTGENGGCRAMLPRFSFNKETKKCEQIFYGGCGATANNFRKLLDCQNACELAL